MFFLFFVLVKIRHVSVFDNILDRKKPFKTIKTESKKKKKSINWDFSKAGAHQMEPPSPLIS